MSRESHISIKVSVAQDITIEGEQSAEINKHLPILKAI